MNDDHDFDIYDVHTKPFYDESDNLISIKEFLEYQCSKCLAIIKIFPDREPMEQDYPRYCIWKPAEVRCPTTGKFCYDSQAAAGAARRSYTQRFGDRMHSFKCKYCKLWHITHWVADQPKFDKIKA